VRKSLLMGIVIGAVGGYMLRDNATAALDLYVPYTTRYLGNPPSPLDKALGCKAKGAAVIFEKPTLSEDKRIKVSAAPGTDTMALTRKDSYSMSMLTGASLSLGSTEGTPLKVVARPNKNIAIAVSQPDPADPPFVLNVIVLDEATGNAVWVRAGTGFGGLTGQSYYMECR
jgi:hypothetical protein